MDSHTVPRTQLELRILRAVDDRPGVIGEVHARSTGFSLREVLDALVALERARLVQSSRIVRTGAVTWRITHAGVEQLIATPPRKMRRGRGRGDHQMSVFEVL